MNNLKGVVIFDIDNTIVCSHSIYDEAFKKTAEQLIGVGFIMTKNPDGTVCHFSKLTTQELLELRFEQLGIVASEEMFKNFYQRLNKNAKVLGETSDFVVYKGVGAFIDSLSRENKLVILTTGPKDLQLAVLARSNLLNKFDLESSFFLSEFITKKQAIKDIYLKNSSAEYIVYVADAPADMKALFEADMNIKKIGIGVLVQGLSAKEELEKAGATYIMKNYNQEVIDAIIKALHED